MYLKRKIDAILDDWRASPDRLPLIIKGPRQVGKTASVLNFARRHYQSVIEINFVSDPKYKDICRNGYSAEDIVSAISFIDPSKRFIPGKTLIFFDEVQAFPAIATSLKFFSIDGRFDVICSGSLLGLSYREIESVSVGYKKDLTLRSLDFEEFLWGFGYQNAQIESLREHVRTRTPFSELEMKVMLQRFTEYCVLGGMPAVLRNFFERSTFEGSLDLQRQLLLDYEEDIQKYLEGLDRTRVLAVFRQIPSQLAKENKKFQVSKIAPGARNKDFQGCFEWLENAGLIERSFCLAFPELPLGGNVVATKFKIYFHDTGLLVASLDDEAQEDLRADRNLGVYKGALYENFVAAALVRGGHRLCYYQREDSTLEEDFFVRTRHSLVPVEVKARNGKSKSLNTLVSSDRYPDIRFGVKLCAGNIGFEGGILTLPYFCTFLLKDALNALEEDLAREGAESAPQSD